MTFTTNEVSHLRSFCFGLLIYQRVPLLRMSQSNSYRMLASFGRVGAYNVRPKSPSHFEVDVVVEKSAGQISVCTFKLLACPSGVKVENTMMVYEDVYDFLESNDHVFKCQAGKR